MTDGAKAIVGLAEAVESLHPELMNAVEAGKGQQMQFSVEPIELTAQVAVTKEADGKIGWNLPGLVAATLRDEREQVGSGYLVSGRLVLTAEHCTRDKVTGERAARLRVVRASDGVVAKVADGVSDHGLDVAALQLDDDAGVVVAGISRAGQPCEAASGHGPAWRRRWRGRGPSRRLDAGAAHISPSRSCDA